MSALHYVQRDWIIERRNADQWEAFPSGYTYKPVTRAQMEAAVERFANFHPLDEFRGHNIAYCACHPTAFKRGRV
jgi:hypothetical protein